MPAGQTRQPRTQIFSPPAGLYPVKAAKVPVAPQPALPPWLPAFLFCFFLAVGCRAQRASHLLPRRSLRPPLPACCIQLGNVTKSS
jgi:hypothetical protein